MSKEVHERLGGIIQRFEGKDEVTRKELMELKWAIYVVDCFPTDNSIDDALAADETSRGDAIKLTDKIKEEVKRWKSWDGVQRIMYK